MYCLELRKFDVSNTSYYVEVENGAQSWKMILGGHGKVVENFYGKSVGSGNPVFGKLTICHLGTV